MSLRVQRVLGGRDGGGGEIDYRLPGRVSVSGNKGRREEYERVSRRLGL